MRHVASAPDPLRNLPAQFTSFVGRELEVGQVLELVRRRDVRLVTLTGPGGVGKTRVAIKAAERLAQDFDDGVFFVSLAPITDAALVTSAIANVLDVQEVSSVPLLRTLQAYVHERKLLLLLDNFEHVIAAASTVADLLIESPRLHVLVTSRAPLHLRGEHELDVPPLRLPEPNAATEPEDLRETESVRLFEERARAVKADFAITRDNVDVVIEICRRLDGLPLALELAAARIKVLTPAALLAHLDWRLPMLTGGARDLPARQQTLRATIGWSYQLLDPSQQQLFRRVTVFVGGCTLSAAAAVCLRDSETQENVLDQLTALVNTSLLQPAESVNGETRVRLLETIREFGLEQLAAKGEAEGLLRRHAEYFRTVAADAEAGLAGAQWQGWRRQLDVERENLRAALSWAAAWSEVDTALGLVGPLWRWFRPDAIAEGRRWVQQALALQGSASPARAIALHALGVLAMQQGDYHAAASAWKESVNIWRAVGDQPHLVDALSYLGSIYRPGAGAVRALLGEAVALARHVGDPRRLALALGFFGWQLLQLDQLPTASAMLAEALPLARMPGDPWELIWILYATGLLAIREGDTALAQQRFAETLERARGARDNMMASLALAASGRYSLREGDIERAETLFREGLSLSRDAGFAIGVAHHLEGIALVCHNRNSFEAAVRLLGAAEAAYPLVDVPGLVPYSSLVDECVTSLRETLGQRPFSSLFADGRGLDSGGAIAQALIVANRAKVSPSRLTDVPVSLTAREVEVLQLLAAGQSNPEIASALVLSVKTVERHLANAYAKIGARSRVEAATYVLAHDLR